MPDIENAEQLYNIVVNDRTIETAQASVITREDAIARAGARETAHVRDLLVLQRDRDYAGHRNKPQFDFELRESRIHFNQIKFALDRAAERERFR